MTKQICLTLSLTKPLFTSLIWKLGYAAATVGFLEVYLHWKTED